MYKLLFLISKHLLCGSGSDSYESDEAVSVKESGVDLARGEGNVESSSSSCSEESSDEEGEDDGQGNDSSSEYGQS